MSIIFLSRRIVLVCSILFIDSLTHIHWQIIAFMLTSLFQSIYLLGAQPYETPYLNKVEVFNELNVLFVGYFSCQMLYSSYDPVMLSQVGLAMIGVIMISVAVNLLLVGLSMLKEMKLKILNWKKTKVLKRRSTTRSKKQQRSKESA